MHMDIKKLKANWIAVAVSAMLVLAAAIPASADLDADMGRRSIPAVRMKKSVAPAVANVTIANKTPEAVITNYGYAYTLSDTIVILDPYGYRQSLDQMWVPSQAKVTYIVENGLRKALRIQLTKVGRDATIQFMRQNPN
jgi:hypothetical protein